MRVLSARCPECGEPNPPLAEFCVKCGARLGEEIGAHSGPAVGGSWGWIPSLVQWLLIIGAVITLLVAAQDDSAVRAAAYAGGAAVQGILARLIQAHRYHVEMMDALRRR